MFQKLQFALLPGTCLLCGLPSYRAMDLCQVCELRLPWNLRACVGCALPLNERLIERCDQCRSRRLVFDQVNAPFLYEGEVARLLAQGKFHAGFTGLALVSDLCASQFASEREMPDVLIPVPLSWRRTLSRGFNQAALVALRLGRTLGITANPSLLKRRRHTRAQSGLTRRARLKNLVGAFQAQGSLLGQHVALVDDVMTTGATALAASKALKKAGASRVVVWVCARTPGPRVEAMPRPQTLMRA